MDRKAKIWIAVGATLVVASVTYIVVKRNSNRKKMEKINAILDGSTPDPSNPQGSDNYWSATFWKKVSPQTKLVSDTQIYQFFKNLATQIYDSVSPSTKNWITDSPSEGFAAFKAIGSKLGVSVLADVFNQKYQQDLFTFLNDKYDTEEQKAIWNNIQSYTNNLPVKINGE